MGLPLQVARLKGRANYLCWYRLEKAKTEGRLASPLEVEQLRAIQQFAGVSSDGDIGGCESVPETASIWPLVTSTTDNCLGSSCPDYSRCHVVAARQKAHAADLVVVNHHLLCADLSLDHSYEAQLLPRVGVMVIDEAHAFADIATQFFVRTCPPRPWLDLAGSCSLQDWSMPATARTGRGSTADWSSASQPFVRLLPSRLIALVLGPVLARALAVVTGARGWGWIAFGGQIWEQSNLSNANWPWPSWVRR